MREERGKGRKVDREGGMEGSKVGGNMFFFNVLLSDLNQQFSLKKTLIN